MKTLLIPSATVARAASAAAHRDENDQKAKAFLGEHFACLKVGLDFCVPGGCASCEYAFVERKPVSLHQEDEDVWLKMQGYEVGA